MIKYILFFVESAFFFVSDFNETWISLTEF